MDIKRHNFVTTIFIGFCLSIAITPDWPLKVDRLCSPKKVYAVFPMECSERDELVADVIEALDRIVEFAEKLQASLHADSYDILRALDQDLENAVGEKERALGALAQHRKDHGC